MAKARFGYNLPGGAIAPSGGVYGAINSGSGSGIIGRLGPGGPDFARRGANEWSQLYGQNPALRPGTSGVARNDSNIQRSAFGAAGPAQAGAVNRNYFRGPYGALNRQQAMGISPRSQPAYGVAQPTTGQQPSSTTQGQPAGQLAGQVSKTWQDFVGQPVEGGPSSASGLPTPTGQQPTLSPHTGPYDANEVALINPLTGRVGGVETPATAQNINAGLFQRQQAAQHQPLTMAEIVGQQVGGVANQGRAAFDPNNPFTGINPIDGLPEAVFEDEEPLNLGDPGDLNNNAPPPGVDPIDWAFEPLQGLFPGMPGYDEAAAESRRRDEIVAGMPNQNRDEDRTEDEGGVGRDQDLPPELRDQPDIGGDNPELPGLDEDWEEPESGGPFGPVIDPNNPNLPGGGGGAGNGGGGAPGGQGGAGGQGGGNGGGGGFPPGFNPDPLEGTPIGGLPGGGQTGAGGNQNALIAALLADFQRANQEGRTANETRYNDLINYLNMRLDRGLANLQGSGEQALSDVDRDSARNAANADQDLISRGLRNSTVRQNVQRGVEDDRQANRRRIQEDVRKERLQTDAVLSGDVLSAMERRTDDYPSSSELIALALQLGQGGHYPIYGGGGTGQVQQPWVTRPGGGLVRNPGYTQQNSNPFGLNRHSPTGTRFG